MKLQSLFLRTTLFFSLALLLFAAPRVGAQSNAQTDAAFQTSAVPARITQAIDETQLVRLKGNVHPLARPEFDQGPVSDATPMKRMMLLLHRSQEQEAALQEFMAEQMSNESPNFHKWLTPQQFGAQYGPADADVQTVTSWLSSLGFTAIRVAPGRNIIEFSGDVGQVRSAFHTEIHKFLVNGNERQANTTDPQIPMALTPVVAGIVSLHNFPSKSMHHVVGQFTQSRVTGEVTPQFTTSGGNFAVGPADFAKIYNIPASLTGTGGNIAIIGFSDIDLNDAHAFRALFGLPANDPVVVNNGPDPGFGNEEGEADLDTQWSGAVAPSATIHYILSEGTLTADPLVLGAEYVIDNNSDDVMSLSFGNCEANMTSTALSLVNSLWEQAAAQGITVTVSAGDNGTAGCDDFNTPAPASGGIAVSGLASTPFNIAVGGTDFDDVGIQVSGGFWSMTNSTDGTRESAQGYIHEVPWNDSCAAAATPANLTTCATNSNSIVAASGGPSGVYARPQFQNGIIPNGIVASDAPNHRYLPDVSLFASDGLSNVAGQNSQSFYVLCQADALQPGSAPSCAPNAQGQFAFFGAGGTSVSAPAFAGIISLIGQSEAAAGRSRRQGNANFVLYKLAQTGANSCNSSMQPVSPASATCIFYDVTKGNNSVPCVAGGAHCSSAAGSPGLLVTTSGATQTPAFTATTGAGSIPSYDLATGLGSVNVTNLANAWGAAVGAFKSTTTVTKVNGANTPVTITHGTSVTLSATVTSGSGTPTGDVSFPAPTPVNGGVGAAALNAGTATLTTTFLPGSGGTSYNLKAHYAGDGTFAPSDDPAGVSVTVIKEASKLQAGIVTFDVNTGNITSNPFASSFPYGSPYILRMDILKNSGTCLPFTTGVTTGCAFDATGTVTVTDNGSPLDAGTFGVNSQGHAEDQPIQLSVGTHNVSATYSGDISYTAPGSPTVLALTVTQAATATSVTPSPTSIASGGSITLTANVATNSSGVGPTGMVQFKNGSTALGSAVNCVPTAATSSAPAFCTATLSTTLSLLPPLPGPHRIPTLPVPWILLAVSALLVLLLNLKRVPPRYRRVYACAALLLLALLVTGLAVGCGGGYGGGGGVHYDSITAVYSGDTNYTGSTSAAQQVTIQ
ncbi:MAG TPA: protease pro-enzyme activation domain-containing protein [Candidatus Acidoferrum sp.]|nr:protease pro-enzyme activation domain-containing protein [Candidatus Acidoferrum sp.]